MTDIEVSIVTKIYTNGEWVGPVTLTRKYKIEWENSYVGVYNEDGFFVDDIALPGSSQKSKEERMEHVVKVLKSWK